MNPILPFQPELYPSLPPIVGCEEYDQQEALFNRVADLFQSSGVEQRFIQIGLKGRKAKPKRVQKLRQGLRCTIARCLLNLSYRKFRVDLACNHLLQDFCEIRQVDEIKIPTLGKLQYWEKKVSTEEVGVLIDEVLKTASEPIHENGEQVLNLQEELDLSVEYLDTTCLKASIHYPVDWLLLRDATRTLMKGVIWIRDKGMKNRMDPPETYLKKMNRLCIEMTHTRRKKEGRKARKEILRKMKKLIRKVEAHGSKHVELLRAQGLQAGLHPGQIESIASRLEKIVQKIPQVIKQAHERIIGERQVPTKEKILSLYEEDVYVIKRGKAGAEVEFGNKLVLCEQEQGLITLWSLRKEPTSDLHLVKPTVEELLERGLQELVGDRGFDSAANRKTLEESKIENRIGAKAPSDWAKQAEDEVFAQRQKRRSQTEARISILFEKFCGKPMKKKGFKNRERYVAWCVLTHNLWVLARLPQAEALAKVA